MVSFESHQIRQGYRGGLRSPETVCAKACQLLGRSVNRIQHAKKKLCHIVSRVKSVVSRILHRAFPDTFALNGVNHEGGCYNFLRKRIVHEFQTQMQECIEGLLLPALPVHEFLKKEPKSYCEQELCESILHLEELVQQELTNNVSETRKWHEDFIGTLRDGIALVLKEPEGDVNYGYARDFLMEVVRNFYVEMDLQDVALEEMGDQFSFFREDGDGGWLAGIREFLTKMRVTHPPQKKYTEMIDPNLVGNFTYKLKKEILRNGRECQLIRMPAVTRVIWMRDESLEVQVNEEFELFLRERNGQQKHHLYVNLMKKDPQFQEEDDRYELASTRVIESLEEENPYFHVLSLDKNTPFYRQSGKERGVHKMEAEDFIETLHENLMNKNLYHWPQSIDEDELDQQVVEISQKIHEEYFESCSQLTKEERQDFIEILYQYMIEYTLIQVDAETANMSCRICCDRGGSENFMYIYFQEKMRNGPLQEKIKEIVKVVLIVPSYLVSNRAPSRVNYLRATQLAERLDRFRGKIPQL